MKDLKIDAMHPGKVLEVGSAALGSVAALHQAWDAANAGRPIASPSAQHQFILGFPPNDAAFLLIIFGVCCLGLGSIAHVRTRSILGLLAIWLAAVLLDLTAWMTLGAVLLVPALLFSLAAVTGTYRNGTPDTRTA